MVSPANRPARTGCNLSHRVPALRTLVRTQRGSAHEGRQTDENRSGDYTWDGRPGEGIGDCSVEDSESRVEGGAFRDLTVDAVFRCNPACGFVEEQAEATRAKFI